MKKNNWIGVLQKKQYVIAGSLVVIAAVGMTALYGNQRMQERKQLEQELAEELHQEQVVAEDKNQQIATNESKNQQTAVNESKNQAIEENLNSDLDAGVFAEELQNQAEVAEESGLSEEQTVNTVEDLAENEIDGNEETQDVAASSQVTALHFSPEDGMLWPKEGNVILNYSMDSTVYFATLDQYKYNPAIMIAGEVNDKVISVARGQIQSIENDEVIGLAVTVDLGDGYQAIYGQLKEVGFEVGDYVEEGQTIGYLSEPTKYFSVEGCNLYFELLKDGVPQDPVALFE